MSRSSTRIRGSRFRPAPLDYAGRVQDLDTLESVSTRLETALSRLASRFRAMPESKLLGRLPDGRPRAAAGHELASLIALAGQGIEDRSRPMPPAWRSLPFEGPFVVGDQIGVTGHDLLAACERLGEGERYRDVVSAAVWAPLGDRCDGAPCDRPRCDRAAAGTVLVRVLAAAEELEGSI